MTGSDSKNIALINTLLCVDTQVVLSTLKEQCNVLELLSINLIIP